MKRVFCGLLGLLATSFAASAQDWPTKEMNRAISQTNMIVNGGCSGTLIDVKRKLILTNYHCVDDNIEVVEREVTSAEGFVKKVKTKRYADVKVEQRQYEGFTLTSQTQYRGDIVAEVKEQDLAIVALRGSIPNEYAPVLQDKVERGERTYVVGNPIGQESSVVEGIVSNMNRTFEFPWTGGEKTPMIQFSGGIIGGNSGGALYNGKGELIGVPAAGYSAAPFIGLAIPISTVKIVLKNACLSAIYDKDKGAAADEACLAKKQKAKEKAEDGGADK